MAKVCPNCNAVNQTQARFCGQCGTPLGAAGPALLPVGAVLQGRYKVVGVLGQGGMGAVYLVEDQQLFGKQWALKEMQDTFTNPKDRKQARELFEQEAQLLAKLSHPNLPQISGFFTENGRHYLLMEYVEGQTLEEILNSAAGFLPAQQVIDWAVQICDVLEYLHTQKPKPIIFRDMKPANVMLTPQGRIKLIDFGIARLFDPMKGTDTIAMGTPGYAAPEQYGGKGGTDPRTDIYSLGATLHHLITKRDPRREPPFSFHQAPPRILNPQCPTQLEGVIMRAVDHDKGKRFASAKDMKRALSAPPAPPAVQAAPPSSTIWSFVLGVTMIVIGITVVLPVGVTVAIPWIRYQRGVMFLNAGEWAKARTYLEQLDFSYKDARELIKESYYRPGVAYFDAGEWQKAWAELRQIDDYKDANEKCPIAQQKWQEMLPEDIKQMIEIPAGEFIMGSEDGEDDEKPAHAVYLDAFKIDKYEVTNVQYQACVTAEACQAQQSSDDGTTNDYYPVTDVTWEQASAYCAWVGKRLPTEAEWEKAARGTDERMYPWGNDINCEQAYYISCDGHLAIVGSYPAGASPYGVMDMAGNAMEWVADWYDDDYYAYAPARNPMGPANGGYKVVRSGLWSHSYNNSARAANREAYAPTTSNGRIGFRCVQ